MFAVLGVQLFYNVRRGEFLTGDANFETLGAALLMLFRCATGESWNGIMHDLTISHDGHELFSGPTGSAPKLPRCSDTSSLGAAYAESDCGSWVAVPYFIAFTLVGFCVLMQVGCLPNPPAQSAVLCPLAAPYCQYAAHSLST
eukprot:5467891-Prymnesium_polylepis.2